jgi:hypothetical protein
MQQMKTLGLVPVWETRPSAFDFVDNVSNAG